MANEWDDNDFEPDFIYECIGMLSRLVYRYADGYVGSMKDFIIGSFEEVREELALDDEAAYEQILTFKNTARTTFECADYMTSTADAVIGGISRIASDVNPFANAADYYAWMVITCMAAIAVQCPGMLSATGAWADDEFELGSWPVMAFQTFLTGSGAYNANGNRLRTSLS